MVDSLIKGRPHPSESCVVHAIGCSAVEGNLLMVLTHLCLLTHLVRCGAVVGAGEVVVYGGDEKPEQGEGLNKPAEVTLRGCWRINKATGQPVEEGPQVVAYEKKLRRHCAENSTRFVSYRAEGGVWKFQVGAAPSLCRIVGRVCTCCCCCR